MQYEMRRPNSEAEAIAILEAAMEVIYGQIEFYRGHRKKAWNGDLVNHVRTEAIHSLAWLADRHPRQNNKISSTKVTSHAGPA